MNHIIVKALLALIDKIPMGTYRTYIINLVLILAWVAFVLFGGSVEVAAAAIGLSVSNIFMRKSNESQSDKLIYIEGLLQDVTQKLAQSRQGADVQDVTQQSAQDRQGDDVLAYDPIDPASVPQGPHADTRVRD